MPSFLEKSTNILVIIACTVVIGQFGYRMVHEPSLKWQPSLPPGERIQDSESLGLNNAPRTMVIVTSHNCQFCIASMPFYRKVADAARLRGTRVVAVTMEDPAENQKFLASHGIAVEKVLSATAAGIRVRMAPLLLLGRDGTVIDSWAEPPRNESLERTVLQLIGNQ